MKREAPYVPCSDVCGEIVQVGPNCPSGWVVGAKAFGSAEDGGLKPEALLNIHSCYLVPQGVDEHVAAGFELNCALAMYPSVLTAPSTFCRHHL